MSELEELRAKVRGLEFELEQHKKRIGDLDKQVVELQRIKHTAKEASGGHVLSAGTIPINEIPHGEE